MLNGWVHEGDGAASRSPGRQGPRSREAKPAANFVEGGFVGDVPPFAADATVRKPNNCNSAIFVCSPKDRLIFFRVILLRIPNSPSSKNFFDLGQIKPNLNSIKIGFRDTRPRRQYRKNDNSCDHDNRRHGNQQ
jgi:hypothetical protein